MANVRNYEKNIENNYESRQMSERYRSIFSQSDPQYELAVQTALKAEMRAAIERMKAYNAGR